MDKYVITQAFTAVIAVILGLLFYALLLANAMTQYEQYQIFINPLLIIVVAIILLGIFSEISRIADMLERKNNLNKPAKRKR